jgi:WbqC-like protein
MSSPTSSTLAVLQPGYLPWLGFFDQMRRADVFVYYDDVQFDKHGWRNRNRVKSTAGAPHWLTVPVGHRGRPRILDVEIDNRSGWARKHVGTLRQFYARAPFLDRYLPDLATLLQKRWERLVDLDLACGALLADWLGLRPRMLRASELDVDGVRSERLVALCQRVGARRYLSGDAARAYLDVALFERHGIEVIWQDYAHPVYSQQHGPFLPYLSVVDLLFNCGEASGDIVAGRPPASSMRA